MQALRHVGFVEEMEEQDDNFPKNPEFRAKMIVDLSKPLVPSCFIPLLNSQVSRVHFRYEGVFHFCKKSGYVGHYTLACSLSDYEEHWRLRLRVIEWKLRNLGSYMVL